MNRYFLGSIDSHVQGEITQYCVKVQVECYPKPRKVIHRGEVKGGDIREPCTRYAYGLRVAGGAESDGVILPGMPAAVAAITEDREVGCVKAGFNVVTLLAEQLEIAGPVLGPVEGKARGYLDPVMPMAHGPDAVEFKGPGQVAALRAPVTQESTESGRGALGPFLLAPSHGDKTRLGRA